MPCSCGMRHQLALECASLARRALFGACQLCRPAWRWPPSSEAWRRTGDDGALPCQCACAVGCQPECGALRRWHPLTNEDQAVGQFSHSFSIRRTRFSKEDSKMCKFQLIYQRHSHLRRAFIQSISRTQIFCISRLSQTSSFICEWVPALQKKKIEKSASVWQVCARGERERCHRSSWRRDVASACRIAAPLTMATAAGESMFGGDPRPHPCTNIAANPAGARRMRVPKAKWRVFFFHTACRLWGLPAWGLVRTRGNGNTFAVASPRERWIAHTGRSAGAPARRHLPH